MDRTFTIILDPNEGGGYTVTVPILPGCVTQGDNCEEALEHAKEAIEGFLEALKLAGLPIPQGDVDVEVDVVTVRLPDHDHPKICPRKGHI